MTSMTVRAPSDLRCFKQSLRRLNDMPLEAIASLAELVRPMAPLQKGFVLQREDDVCPAVFILTAGMVVASKSMRNGSQQHVAIFVAGDVLNWSSVLLGSAQVTLSALTTIDWGQIEKAELQRYLQNRGDVCLALWTGMAAQATVTQEWMIGLGSRTAQGRMAHFMCELFMRSKRVGLVEDDRSCPFPMTQAELAATVGLSVVHTNRVLQQLRGETLFDIRKQRLTVLDWPKLTRVAQFDATYLF